MSREQRRKASLIIGLAAGAFADGYLRLISGDEGNLLIHSMVFLGGALIAAGAAYGFFYAQARIMEISGGAGCGPREGLPQQSEGSGRGDKSSPLD